MRTQFFPHFFSSLLAILLLLVHNIDPEGVGIPAGAIVTLPLLHLRRRRRRDVSHPRHRLDLTERERGREGESPAALAPKSEKPPPWDFLATSLQ